MILCVSQGSSSTIISWLISEFAQALHKSWHHISLLYHISSAFTQYIYGTYSTQYCTMSASERSPTPTAEVSSRRKHTEWTRREELCLVEILMEHPDWAAILIHNRCNDRVCRANKAAIGKEIGLQLQSEDPPDGKVVCQKVKTMTSHFKIYYDRLGQIGQGILHAELDANSPMLRERNRILQEEPWFDQFHQLFISCRPTQTLDVFSGGISQEQVCSQIPSFSALQLGSYPEAASQANVDLDPDLDGNNESDSDNADLPSLGTLGEHLLATPAPSASSSRSNQSVLSPDQINSQLSACRDQLVKKQKHSIFNDDQIASQISS